MYAKESRLDVCTATLRHIETSPMVSMNGNSCNFVDGSRAMEDSDDF